MKVHSSQFGPGGVIPQKFSRDTENINPTLTVVDIPEGTKSLLVVMDDRDASNAPAVHWLVYDIPVSHVIEKNNSLGQNGKNDFAALGYQGPGLTETEHEYSFRVYALDEKLGLGAGLSLARVEQSMVGHVLDNAEMRARFGGNVERHQ